MSFPTLHHEKLRRISVGVTGGVAAYKAAELVRALQQGGAEVQVVMTRAAEEFVRPLTFSSLTGRRVITGLWDGGGEGETSGLDDDGQIEHIAEAQWPDAIVIAPATAHVLAKVAHGLADDFLSTMLLAATCPVVVAPAMNVNMWNHAATRANVALLRERGVIFVEPERGYLACGMVGSGRLASIEAIADAVFAAASRTAEELVSEAQEAALGANEFACEIGRDFSPGVNDSRSAWALAPGTCSPIESTEPSPSADGIRPYVQDLAGETVLVTAGGTREAIDPVRFIGNRSSGKMGYALAEAAKQRGAEVVLVSAPTALVPPAGCALVPVTSAEEMRAAVMEHLAEATVVIGAAAVADFRMPRVSEEKLRREDSLHLELEPTEDILREVSAARRAGTLVIAFAAEMDLDIARAREKLRAKGADAIVLNDVSQQGLGFDSDRNAAIFVTADDAIEFAAMPKRELANRILDHVASLLRAGKAAAV